MNSSDSTRMSNHCCWAKPMAEPNTLLALPAGKLQERVDFLEELNRWYANELDILSSIAVVYQHCLPHGNSERILGATLPFLQRIAPFNAIGFALTDEEGLNFNLRGVGSGSFDVTLPRLLDQLIDNGQFGWAVKQQLPTLYKQKEQVNVLACPIAVPNQTLGMMIATFEDERALPPRAQRLLMAVLQHCAYALHNVRLYHQVERQNHYLEKLITERNDQLEHASTYDALTDLPTREHFQEEVRREIQRAQRDGSSMALILLDIDFFKRINESLGHAVGDLILKRVAQRLASNVREYDPLSRLVQSSDISHVGRFGGDEFCVLLSGQNAQSQINAIIERISRALSEPFKVAQHELLLAFSAGVACYPDHAAEPEKLLQLAEIALHQAKQRGRNRHLLYQPSMGQESLHQLALGNKLRHALVNGQFQLHYQPQIDIREHQVIGIEALLRWQDESGDWIPPNHFIPLAEESGMITPIGAWVIEEVCRLQSQLQKQGYSIPVAINISAHQFTHATFLDSLLETMRRHQVPAELIELELTERAIMQDVQETIDRLQAIHRQGIKISIDDFGTGYSSLSYLKRFPIDILKIDRSFIQDVDSNPEDAAIVNTIIALGKSLNLQLIAEGVERAEQVRFLREQGCYGIQGYFYSRPLSEADLLRYLELG